MSVDVRQLFSLAELRIYYALFLRQSMGYLDHLLIASTYSSDGYVVELIYCLGSHISSKGCS